MSRHTHTQRKTLQTCSWVLPEKAHLSCFKWGAARCCHNILPMLATNRVTREITWQLGHLNFKLLCTIYLVHGILHHSDAKWFRVEALLDARHHHVNLSMTLWYSCQAWRLDGANGYMLGLLVLCVSNSPAMASKQFTHQLSVPESGGLTNEFHHFFERHALEKAQTKSMFQVLQSNTLLTANSWLSFYPLDFWPLQNFEFPFLSTGGSLTNCWPAHSRNQKIAFSCLCLLFSVVFARIAV